MRTIIGLCVLGLVACGSSSEPPKVSCTVAADGSYGCFEMVDPNALETAAFNEACSGEGGTPSSSGCTATNRVGRCAVTEYGYTFTFSFYAPVTAAEGEAACTTGLTGVWTGG